MKPFNSRLNALDEEQEYEENEQYEEHLEEEVEQETKVDGRYKRITEDMDNYESEVEYIEPEEKDEGRLIEHKDDQVDAQWLNGVTFGEQQPCWKLANTGSCDYGTSCKFSHHPTDIAKYKAAKELGPDVFKKVADKNKTTWFKTGDKPSSGFGSSPGIKPRVTTPTSILKRTGPVTRKQV